MLFLAISIHFPRYNNKGENEEKMNRRTWTDQQLIEAVEASFNYSEAGRKLGLSNFGGNSRTIKKRIQELKIDTTHFLTSKELLRRNSPKIAPMSCN